jgi:hypothetical protein
VNFVLLAASLEDRKHMRVSFINRVLWSPIGRFGRVATSNSAPRFGAVLQNEPGTENPGRDGAFARKSLPLSTHYSCGVRYRRPR